MTATPNIKSVDDHVLILTRLIDAPRELVFSVCTDPKHVIHWWGPRDYPIRDVQMDLRPGGKWRGCLTSVEDGRELWQGGVLREVIAPERLVFTFAWEEEGEPGLETLVTMSFAEEDGKTRLTLHQTPFRSVAERDGHSYGWSSCFDRLEEYLSQMS